MRNFRLGALFALQFFSVFPIRRNIEPTTRTVRSSLRWLPILGLSIGTFNALMFYGLDSLTSLSLLSLIVFAIIIPAIWSGGLHLDGLMDTGDAFFSYQDKHKRLEVMKDPRTGAFGVLVLLVVLIIRFVFMYEAFLSDFSVIGFLIVVPLLSRCMMMLLLGHGTSARESGLCYFFKKHYNRSVTYWIIGLTLVVCAAMAFLSSYHFIISLAMILASIIVMWGVRVWAIRSFGGITGDVCGALLEGTETCLWFIVWLFYI
ncbi:adenosylcobinamide-GDP ribazoletransferase [Virgibacillus necropolis]|uniref:Adenosylcobinamide-GDP ribazoletransferase n=1 Tax=Virgibacillus necropolis TaxID=163877 RepID=A0A221MAM8_9BACI|nr:adenosylcobinamide-GDP ribazoletransferase [Virgibacillus necropolis]ASN04687.1 adenosylcobinamide-GDP ribazoletransferase [Virgibacillus necropolis]